MNFSSLYSKLFHSVKSKLIFNVLLIHAVLMSLIVFDLTQREKNFMQEQISQKGYELTSVLASNASVALLNNDLVALDELLMDMHIIKDNYMIFILDKHGRVRASTQKEYFNKYLDDNVSKDLLNTILDNNLVNYQTTHDNLVDTVYTVQVNNKVIGYARTLIDRTPLENQIRIITNQGLLYILLAMIIGAFFAWLSVRKITDRLNRVAEAAERISKKDFDVHLPSSNDNDELSKMIDAFNVMHKSIQEHITLLDNSTNELKESEKKLLEAQEIATIGSWELSLKTNKMYWSPVNFKIHNQDPDTYIPTLEKFFKHLSDKDKLKTETALKNIISSGKRTEVNIEELQKDGSSKYLHITGIANYDEEGKPYRVTGTTQDFTQQKENELKLQEKEKQLLIQSRLAQMGELISMIAHQWRQPLSAISAESMNMKLKITLNTYNLNIKESQEDFKKYILNKLDKIDEYVQGLSTTIDDFRNFYKRDKKFVQTSIDSIVVKSLNIIKASIENNNIKIIYEANSNIKIDLYDNEVMQVILNILKNAQDSFKNKNIDNKYIKITTDDTSIKICDNGGGIPEDIIDKIFDPYFSSKDEKNGTGLGLYMSKIIISKHHNGSINAINTDDGVCFYIKFQQ